MARVVLHIIEACFLTLLWAWLFWVLDYPAEFWFLGLILGYTVTVAVVLVNGYPIGWLGSKLRASFESQGADPRLSALMFLSVATFNGGLSLLLVNLLLISVGHDPITETYLTSHAGGMALGGIGITGCFAISRIQQLSIGSDLLGTIFGIRPRTS